MSNGTPGVSVWRQRVHCPIEGCEYTTKRSNLMTHLQTKQHGIERAESNRMAKEAEAVTTTAVVAVSSSTARRAGRPPKQREERGPDLTTMSPTDIALGVIESQAAGPIPAELLAEVIAYVDHTRTLIGALRDLKGRAR